MPKGKISDVDLLKKDEYRSIMNLLRYCHSYIKDDKGKECWLSHAQIFYALRKNEEKNNKEMKEFFYETDFSAFNPGIKSFEVLYGGQILPSGRKTLPEVIRCIKYPQQLNEKLKTLKERGWIEVKGKPKYRQYRISLKYYTDGEKKPFEYYLNIWKPDEIVKKQILFGWDGGFKTPNADNVYNWSNTEETDFLLCGLSTSVIDKLGEKEKKDLQNWVLNIEKNLWKIMELKYTKMKIPYDEYIKNLRTKSTDQNLYIRSSIGFYYHGYKSLIER